MFERKISTSSDVESFCVDEKHIVAITERVLQVYDRSTYEKTGERQIFSKAGKARSVRSDQDFVYCVDFITLYVIDKKSLDTVSKITLGTDLSSDICGKIVTDEQSVYASIRNGQIAKIEKGNWQNVRHYPISETSMWSMAIRGDIILAGNVEGRLLVVDTKSMKVTESIQAHAKNTKSIYITDDYIATAGQDLALALWETDTLKPINRKRKAHKKACSVAGHWDDRLLSLSFRCGELKVWNSGSFEEEKTIPIEGCLTGDTSLAGDRFFISSRAIQGIEEANIKELLR